MSSVNSINGTSSIFAEMGTYNKPQIAATNVSESKPDTFEKQTPPDESKSKKKKLIIAGAAIGAAAIAAIIFFKRGGKGGSLVKKVKDSVPSSPNIPTSPSIPTPPVLPVPPVNPTPIVNAEQTIKAVSEEVQTQIVKPETKEIVSNVLPNPKTFEEKFTQLKNDFINPLKESKPMPQGVLFYGQNAEANEVVMEDFIKTLSDEGVVINRLPKFENMNFEDFAGIIISGIEQAQKAFEKTKQRTAIVIKNLNSIALNRNTNPESIPTVAALLEFENTKNNGLTWITDSINPKAIDSAIIRAGRIDRKLQIPAEEVLQKGEQVVKNIVG